MPSRDDLPDHLFRWLEGVQRRMAHEVGTAARADGDPRLSSGSRNRTLQLIPSAGIRLSALAETVGVTKQAIGQQITALAQAGLVSVVLDDADRRARLVRRTPEGDVVSARINELMAAVEDKLADDVGPRDFAVMKDVLRRLSVDE